MPRMRKPLAGFSFAMIGQRGLVEIGDQLGHLLLLRVLRIARLDGRNGKTFAVRVGIGQRAFEALAAEHDDEAMFLAGLDDDLRVADLLDLGGEHGAELLAGLGRDAAGAAVGDDALGVERGEIGAGADIAGLEFHAQAERFDDAAADLEFERVVAEQARGGRDRCRA